MRRAMAAAKVGVTETTQIFEHS
ncbi:MAG: hypothetical protein JWO53_551, partial [Chlamydiia bacterium]|nr:hypothetical protein [Chlamydiia bacterium]